MANGTVKTLIFERGFGCITAEEAWWPMTRGHLRTGSSLSR